MHTQGWTAARDLRGLSLAFFGGILLVYALPQLLPAWLGLVFLPLLLPRWPGRWLLLAALAGALWATLDARQRLESQLPAERHGEDRWLSGWVAGLPERQGGDLRFRYAVAEPDQPGQLRVTWYRAEQPVQAGECWRFRLRLRAPRGLSNPGGFDYAAWLFREDIAATAYVRAAERCALEPPAAARPALALLRLRARIVRAVTAELSGHPMLAVVLGLSVGDAGGITDEQWRSLRRTGTTHLLSISGLHIALFAGAMFFVLRWLWVLPPRLALRLPAQRAGVIAAALAGLVYSALAGFSIPTQRALIMLLVALLALWWGRLTRPSQLLAVALLAVLLHQPAAVLYPGFWLSFGAVAWIAYIGSGRLAAPGRVQGLLRLQLALSLALAPLCLFWFGEMSLAGVPANLVLIPVFGLLLPLLLFGIGLLFCLPAAGGWLLRQTALLLDGLWQGLEWLAQLPLAYWSAPSPALPALLLALVGMVLLLAPRGFPARWLSLPLCLPALLWRPPLPPPGAVELALLDVGQGLAAVLRTERHVLLFDAGPASRSGFDTGESVVLPYLRQAGIRRVDRLVLSHGDGDHRGGLDAVRAGVPVLEELGTDRGSACRAGQSWHWDGVEFEILHPDAGRWSDNDGSCVLQVRAGRHALLLTGDIEAEAESALVAAHGAALRATVLVVPHHGSRSSSTAAFIARVQPQLALVPAGWRNRWGFPRAEVSARYRAAGAQLEVSGESGAILLQLHPQQGVTGFTRWREQHPRLWRPR